jgi:opacity protein-like surface antigen
VGYDFNEFFALELGGSYFLGKSSIATADIGLPGPVPAGTVLYDESSKAWAVDFVGKLSLPLDNGFRLYTKFGAEFFVITKPPTFTNAAPYVFADVDRKTVSVLFGVGAAYELTPAWSLDLSWTYFRGNSELGGKFMPEVDFYSLGIYYKFICAQ